MIQLALLVGLGPAVGQGFGRFAYALLLVPMQASLGWNYAQAGVITSANALGYLAGALLVGPAATRWGGVRVVRISLLITSLSLIGTGLVQQYWVMLAMRVISGFSTGMIFIGGAAVVLQAAQGRSSDVPLAIFYGGPGLGIALSGLVIPLLLGPRFALPWPAAWVGMGLVGLLASLFIEPALRQAARAAPLAVAGVGGPRLFVASDYLRLWPAMTAYALFGLGYIGYMTFVVAFMQAMQVAPPLIQSFWVVLGVCASCTGLVWGPIIRRLAAHQALALILLALTVGALLPLLLLTLWSFALSALLFGGSFLAVVTAVTKQVRETLPRERWTPILGNATALFAAGQLLGPLLTGLIADMQGGLTLGLLGSAGLLALALLVIVLGPKPRGV